LVEVLSFLLVFSIAAVSLSYMHVVSLRGARFGSEALAATIAAQRQMDVFKNTAYPDVQSNLVGVLVQPGMTMKWIVVETLSAIPGRSFKSIDVTLEWGGNRLAFNTMVIS
jgi:hypothetical protein